MNGTIATQISVVNDDFTKRALRRTLGAIANVISSQMLASAALTINAVASPLAKTGATAVNASINGRLVAVPAGTVLPAPTGTTLINTFNVYVFLLSTAGFTIVMGTAATTLGGVVWPNVPLGSTIVSAFTVNPTTASFIGGTTALDAANTNVVFISPVGAFDPTLIVV